MEKIEFKSWKDTDDFKWEYSPSKLPIGQQWGYDSRLGLVTNCRGEGFTIHRGTKYNNIIALVDILNKRDVTIAELRKEKE